MKNSINFQFEKPEENTGYLLWQTTMSWQRKMNRVLDEIGLTHTQFVILAALGWLSKNQHEITQKDIAEHSNTDRMMVSKLLRKLQKKEFIKRRENQNDTRSKLVSITEKGALKLQEALIEVENTDNDFFSVIDQSDEFNKTLSELISSNEQL